MAVPWWLAGLLALEHAASALGAARDAAASFSAEDWTAGASGEPRSAAAHRAAMGAPGAGGAEAKPLIAVCIVGLFRNHIADFLPNFRTHVLNNSAWDADIFVETWTRVGVSRRERLRLRADDTGAELRADFHALYGPRLRHVRVEQMPPNVSRAFHGVELPYKLFENNPKHYGSTLPNTRKVWQCYRAKRSAEAAMGRRYDAVAKVRPDFGCAHPTYPTFVRAIRRVLEHGRDPAAQPRPFFHSSAWPAAMVSDQSAVGTSAAMDVYMAAWEKLGALWRMRCMPQVLPPACNFHMVDEKLLKVYMMCYAPFDHTPHYCCSPLQRVQYVEKGTRGCERQRSPGGEDWALMQRLLPADLFKRREDAVRKQRQRRERSSGRALPADWQPGSPLPQTPYNRLIVCPPDSYAALHGEPRGHLTRRRRRR